MTLLIENKAQEVQGIGVARILLQNLLIDCLRFIESAGTM